MNSRCNVSSVGMIVLVLMVLLAIEISADERVGTNCSLLLLDAHFDQDVIDSTPNATLPGPPDGDYLTLGQTFGTINVRSSVGTLTSQPVELRHDSSLGTVSVIAYPADYEYCDSMRVSWSSLVRGSGEQFCRCELRSPSGAIIASLEYRSGGQLTYNAPDRVLSTGYAPDVAQDFDLFIDFEAETTSLDIDGIPIPETQDISFVQSCTELGYVSLIAQSEHMAFDNLQACSYCITNDPPVLVVADSQMVTEGNYLQFNASATDDTDTPTFLLANEPLGAELNDNGDGTATFQWTPGYTASGTYYPVIWAFDTQNEYDSQTVKIIVFEAGNQPPVISPIAPQSAPANSYLSVEVFASDAESIPGLSAAGLPNGATFFDNGDGTASFAWTPTPAQTGAHYITVIAEDDSMARDSSVIYTAVLNEDGTVGLAYYDPDANFEYLPLAPSEYMGYRFTNPSPVDSIELAAYEFLLYKEPGVVYPENSFLEVGIYSTDDSLYPDSPLYVTTIAIDTVGNGSRADSVFWLKPNIPIVQLGEAEEWVISFINQSTLPVHLVTDGIDSVLLEDAGPCDLYSDDVERIIHTDFTQPAEYEYVTHVRFSPFARFDINTTNEFAVAGPIQDVAFREFDHFMGNLPIENEITITSPQFYYNRFSQVQTVTAGGLANYPVNWDDGVGRVVIAETSTGSQPPGQHHFSVFVNNTEYYRTCFHSRDNYLVDAPWAQLDWQYFPGSPYNWQAVPGLYGIEAIVPPIDLTYEEVISIPLIVYTYDLLNRVDFNVNLYQDYWTDGTLESSLNDDLEIILFNKVIFDESLGGTVGEAVHNDGSPYLYYIIPPKILWEHDWKILTDHTLYYNQCMCCGFICILSGKVTMDLGIKGAIEIEAALKNPPDVGDYGDVTFTPIVTVYANVDADVDFVFGLVSAHADADPSFIFEFPFVLDGGTGDLSTGEFCTEGYLEYGLVVDAVWGYFDLITVGPYELVLWDNCDNKAASATARSEDPMMRFAENTWFYIPHMSLNETTGQLMSVFSHPNQAGTDEIVYSFHGLSNWNQPEVYLSSETSKLDVNLTAHGQNGFAAVWAERFGYVDPGTLTMENIYDLLRLQDIVVATYDADSGWSEPMRLTDDNNGDGRPVMASCSDKLYAAWVRQEAGDELDRLNMKIYYAFYDGQTWSTPVALPGQSGYNLHPAIDVAPLDGKVYITWIQDEDGDEYSPGDRHIMLASLDTTGGIGSAVVESIPSELGPFNAEMAVGPSGELVIAYETWGLVYDSLGAPVDSVGIGDCIRISSTIRKGSEFVVQDLDSEPTYGANPDVIMDENGKAHLAFRQIEKYEPGRYDGEIAYSSMDINQTDPVWSPPQRLTDDTLLTFMGHVGLDSLGRVHILYQKDTATSPEYPHGYDQIFELVFDNDNNYTPPGNDIHIGLLGAIDMYFDNVILGGWTQVFASPSGPALPEGMTALPADDPVYYDITTTAEFTGNIGLEIGYRPDTSGFYPEDSFRILHHDGSAWSDITTSVDTSENKVYGMTSSLSTFVLAAPSTVECGDATGDGTLNVGDAVRIIDYVFKGGPAPDPLCSGDADGDDQGSVNVSDVVYLINYIFKGGAAPVANCCAK